MICNDWKNEKMTSKQLVTNLFEMKEELGKEHVAEIVVMLCGAEHGNRFSLSDSSYLSLKLYVDMFTEALHFCKKDYK